MTKNQMKLAALEIMKANKANKALTAELTELFEEFAKTSNNDTVKRPKIIEVDGVEYAWCNRHEVYEPATNFKRNNKQKDGTMGYATECNLAAAAWRDLSKLLNEAKEHLQVAIDDENYQVLPELNKKVKELTAQRGGRYSYEANALKYPDCEGYIYNEDGKTFIKE